MDAMSTPRAVSLYVGALLGPSILLLPGLAARIAGPASLLAWLLLLAVSALLAVVFSALGRRYPGRSGAAGFAGAAFGPGAERAVAACFLVGVVLGAPVVCLIGAGYVTPLFGGGPRATVAVAAALLVAVVAVTRGGARASAAVQLGLVVVLAVLVAVGSVGALPSARLSHLTPFLPHGWSSVGTAGSVIMLSCVGWEAIAPLTARLRAPHHQLPRVIAWAFVITATGYLTTAVATVAVLGAGMGSSTPLADLLRIAVGPLGAVAAAVAAVALTVAATNAYLSGAAEVLAELRGRSAPSGRFGAGRLADPRRLPSVVGAVGIVLFALTACGWLSTVALVALPTSMFLAVYLAATAAGARLLPGAGRAVAATACVGVGAVLACTGPVAVLPLLLVVGSVVGPVVGSVVGSPARHPAP